MGSLLWQERHKSTIIKSRNANINLTRQSWQKHRYYYSFWKGETHIGNSSGNISSRWGKIYRFRSNKEPVESQSKDNKEIDLS